MSGHEESLIGPPDNDETSSNVYFPEWSVIIPEQPLEPSVLNESLSMSTQSHDLEPSSDNSKAVQASGSVPSLPSLNSNYSLNYASQSHSWPRSNTECRTRNVDVKHRSSVRTPNQGDNKTISSLPTSYQTTPIASSYSSQATLQEESTDTSSSDAAIVEHPCIRRIIWVMASVAFLICGAAVGLVVHSLLQENTSSTIPLLEEAEPSDPHEVIDLDLDMGTS